MKNIQNPRALEVKDFLARYIFNYKSFLLLIITGAMYNNLDHSASLYMKISSDVSLHQAYSVVVIFDLIIIALIGVGDSKAVLFAISVFFINELAWDGVNVFYLIYMKAFDVDYKASSSVQEYLSLIEKAITMLIYGSTFAFTVHHFSVLLKRLILKQTKLNILAMGFRKQLADLSAEHADAIGDLADSKKNTAELTARLVDDEQKHSATLQQLSTTQQQTEKLSTDRKELQRKLTIQIGDTARIKLELIEAEKTISLNSGYFGLTMPVISV